MHRGLFFVCLARGDAVGLDRYVRLHGDPLADAAERGYHTDNSRSLAHLNAKVAGKCDPRLLLVPVVAMSDLGVDPAGRLRSVIAQLGRALQHDPGNVAAHVRRSKAYHCLGEIECRARKSRTSYRRAITQLDLVLRLDPELWEAYYYRGCTIAAMADLEDSGELFDRANADFEHAIRLKDPMHRPPPSPAAEASLRTIFPEEKGNEASPRRVEGDEIGDLPEVDL